MLFREAASVRSIEQNRFQLAKMDRVPLVAG
jgi:hypothetical protein